MHDEGQMMDRKSLRLALGKQADNASLACHCVGFANAMGGQILLGIEDGASEPPAAQRIPDVFPDQLRKRISQLTVNVWSVPEKLTAPNGGEYVVIRVSSNPHNIASTSDGRYYLRVSDETRPLLPGDLGRLVVDRNTFTWELQTAHGVSIGRCDPGKLEGFIERIRASERVSPFVKAKSDEDLLYHYYLARNGLLTNLGILWIGRREDRAALLYAPVIQCIKFDERGQKIRKQMWADFTLNPLEMIEAVWREVPDWQESYELSEGLFRKSIPHYEEVVVRELLANALIHRPYSQQGDIFINLFADRMEVHNPGLLPVGVTPRNILHTSMPRNQHLARVCYDLKLMEREGSGYDRIYATLLQSGRPIPVVHEGNDRVVVTVQKHIMKPEIIDFMAKALETFHPNQHELIALGLIAQHGELTISQLTQLLELRSSDDLKNILSRLRNWNLVQAKGRTKGIRYLVEPEVLRKLEFKGGTNLKGIENHRLRELVLRDLEIYRKAKISDIHKRIGLEIPIEGLRKAMQGLMTDGFVCPEGEKKGRKYILAESAEKA